MSSPHPKGLLRGLVLVLTVLLVTLGPPLLPRGLVEAPRSRAPGLELWHWMQLLAGGGWALGQVALRRVRKTDSEESPFSPGCESQHTPPSAPVHEERSWCPLEQRCRVPPNPGQSLT